ncbi:MAG: GntR family transcriptional regulator [Burkholderiaceae bacterium]|nr:GntR family transcriptional regulator [Burkholderiaceae bacterium]
MPATDPAAAAPLADAFTDAPEGASDAVFFGIVHGLERRVFVPGQRLVEADLAARFDVGRNSVREALQRLAAEGVVEILRHKGAAIRALTVQETMDVLEVAERMTGLLARSAARGVAAGRGPQALARALQQLRSADSAQDPDAFARARRSFWRALLDLAANRELRRLFPSIHMPIVYAQHPIAALQKLRLRDYEAIGQAVAQRREELADARGMEHVRNVRREIQRQLAS